MHQSSVDTTTATAGPRSGRPIRGGTVTWACFPGFPPSTIFPFTPAERIGVRNLYDFQMLLYRPLYWFGSKGEPAVDEDLSLARLPQWSPDGRTATVTLKPWKWSNGEPVSADNVMFFVNMMAELGSLYGKYVPGYFPDNLVAYDKVAEDQVRFTFDRVYSKKWVLMNQLSLITPMPKAWDRVADDRPANASANRKEIQAVYEYLVSQNGDWTAEDNTHRTRWPQSPIWSVVNGPWKLKRFTRDGIVSFIPNERYSGPNPPHLDEFRQLPTGSDEDVYRMLEAGPDGPDAIQVGFLPYGFSPDSTDDPTMVATNPFAAGYTLVPQTVFCVRYMAINFNNPTVAGRIFKQAYFRQALQGTLDQRTAIRDIYRGYAYPTHGPVPLVPASDLVSPRLRAAPAVPFDLARARRLLADNGWDVSTTPAVCVRAGTGPGCAGEGIELGTKLSFRLRYAEGRPALSRLMHQLQRDAAQAGIELILLERYASALVGEEHPTTPTGAPHRWELSCWHGGWVYEYYPTGEAAFQTGAASNYGRYSDPTADALIARTVQSDDLGAMYEYQDYLAEQVPVVFTPNFPLRLLEVARNLRGWEPINPLGMINPENWYYVEE